MNLTGAELLGISRHDAVNQPFSAYIFPEAQDIYYLRRKQLFETGEPQSFELRLLRIGSASFWGRLDLTCARNAQGDPVCRAALCDVTEHRRMENNLKAAHDELQVRIAERTAELQGANVMLAREILEHKQAKEKLEEIRLKLREENLYLRKEIGEGYTHTDIIGNSEEIRNVLKMIEQVAPTDSTVLLQGETGTGKELIAQAIHAESPRKGQLLVKVNCAALPPTLIESELFGREKGAFTGALAKQCGRFELANDSSIFLDEIDSLPLDLQAKLLRVLESGEFERLGSPRTIKVNVRIIAATNCDLAQVLLTGSFGKTSSTVECLSDPDSSPS